MSDFPKGPHVRDDDIFITDFTWGRRKLHYGVWISKDLLIVTFNNDKAIDCRRMSVTQFMEYGWTKDFKDVVIPIVKAALQKMQDPSISPNSKV